MVRTGRHCLYRIFIWSFLVSQRSQDTRHSKKRDINQRKTESEPGSKTAVWHVYSLDGILVFGLLFVCTCAYFKKVPRLKTWLLSEKKGVWGVFYKAAVIGTRLHAAVAIACVVMAFYVLFIKWIPKYPSHQLPTKGTGMKNLLETWTQCRRVQLKSSVPRMTPQRQPLLYVGKTHGHEHYVCFRGLQKASFLWSVCKSVLGRVHMMSR